MALLHTKYVYTTEREGKQISKTERIEEEYYCDDCNKLINHGSYSDREHTCTLCWKHLCDEHIQKFTIDFSCGNYDHQVICSDCKKKFAKEINCLHSKVKTKEELLKTIDNLNIHNLRSDLFRGSKSDRIKVKTIQKRKRDSINKKLKKESTK